MKKIIKKYEIRSRLNCCGNSILEPIITTIFTIFASFILFGVINSCTGNILLAIIISAIFLILGIREQWAGLLWIEKKSEIQLWKEELEEKRKND